MLIIAALADLSGTVGSGVSVVAAAFIALRAAGAAVVFGVAGAAVVFGVAGVVASLVGVTSVSFLPTPVVFCVVSFAFVCLSLSCVVSWGFFAPASALVVVAGSATGLSLLS